MAALFASPREVAEESKLRDTLVSVSSSLSAATAIAEASALATGAGTSSGEDVASQVSRIVTPSTHRHFDGRSILWVDDRPANNNYLIKAFQALKINVDTALSTEEAMNLLATRKYDVVLTDMGRPPDREAAYTLLKAMRSKGFAQPVLIHAGYTSEAQFRRAREAGAYDSTGYPQRIFSSVTRLLQDPWGDPPEWAGR